VRPYWKGYLKLALVACPIASLVRSSWSTNCQLRCAISWSGCELCGLQSSRGERDQLGLGRLGNHLKWRSCQDRVFRSLSGHLNRSTFTGPLKILCRGSGKAAGWNLLPLRVGGFLIPPDGFVRQGAGIALVFVSSSEAAV
jgi:hypothetical protein